MLPSFWYIRVLYRFMMIKLGSWVCFPICRDFCDTVVVGDMCLLSGDKRNVSECLEKFDGNQVTETKISAKTNQ